MNRYFSHILLALIAFFLGFFIATNGPKQREQSERHSSKVPRDGTSVPPMRSANVSSRARFGIRADEEESGGDRYAHLVGFLAKADVNVNGVDLDSRTFHPGRHVQEFFKLTDGEMDQLKEVGAQRREALHLWETQNATSLESNDQNITLELPPALNFVKNEQQQFMADLEEILGAEGAKILGKDVKGVYRGVNLRRVISYSLTAQEGGLIGCSMDYEHFDENGDTVAKGSNGSSFDPNDHSADAFRTRYHHLIQIDRE